MNLIFSLYKTINYSLYENDSHMFNIYNIIEIYLLLFKGKVIENAYVKRLNVNINNNSCIDSV